MGVLYTIHTYALIHFATAIISLILVVLIWQRRKIQGGFALLLLFSMVFYLGIVCRFGGDEFAVLLPEMSEDDAIKRAEHWRHLIKKKHVLFRNNAIAPTISIGITTYSRSKLKNQYLIEHADKALYTAKSEGRDCVRVYNK